MAVVYGRFDVLSFAQAENLKVLIAAGQYAAGPVEFSEEHESSVEYSTKEIELIDGDSVIFYLASKAEGKNYFEINKGTPSHEFLLQIRRHLLDIAELDKAAFAFDIPEFEEAQFEDPVQIAVFASLYPFYANKFKFVSHSKWFSKFFKNGNVNRVIKLLKAQNFKIVSAVSKRDKVAKGRVQKKAVENSRVVDAQHTGKLLVSGLDFVRATGAILPSATKENILITSALPYVNNVPHLGNIVGSVLSADVYARYIRHKKNYNVLFIGGTDEYGTATETKALEEKTTPRALCDKYYVLHKAVYDWFGISFDFFGRTTTEAQTEITQEVFLQCWDNGFLDERTIEQLYCEKHQGFLADRFVNGECPNCHYEKARGDQCDSCGKLLNPLELINPKCKLDGHTPVARFSDHVYLRLDLLEPETKQWIEKASKEGGWTKNTVNITNSWLREGLRPFSITRDLKWGTPVPLEKYSDKVVYVWFEATIGYPLITKNYFLSKGADHRDSWKKWWKNPDNVKLYQFMGKDNVSFHLIIFPATQIGTKDGWTKNHHIDTTEYLQYEGGKFSKSEKIGVFGDMAKETGISASVWRYYLVSVRPETSDSQFSWEELVRVHNSELLANLGNFVNRLVKFVNKNYNGVVPEVNAAKLQTVNAKLELDLAVLVANYNRAGLHCEERKMLEIAMNISSRGNAYLQENKLDNNLFNNHAEVADIVVYTGLNLLALVSEVISPIMPEVSDQINAQLNVSEQYIPDSFEYIIQSGHNIGQPKLLFSKIEESMVAVWRNKYGGVQA